MICILAKQTVILLVLFFFLYTNDKIVWILMYDISELNVSHSRLFFLFQ